MQVTKLLFSQLELSPHDILKEMGYGDEISNEVVNQSLVELFALVEKEVVPQYTLARYDGLMHDGVLTVDGQQLEAGDTISRLLKGSQYYYFFVATAGLAFEKIMERVKQEGDMLTVYLLDTLGTCIVEKAGDLMERDLEQQIGSLKHTNRFSPGYCGWSLTEQTKIFALLGGSPCDVSLSDVCLMHPIKSISGIMGVGENVSRKLYGCHFCELKTCYKRKRLFAKQNIKEQHG